MGGEFYLPTHGTFSLPFPPLYAIYNKSILPYVNDLIDKNKKKIIGVFYTSKTKFQKMNNASWLKNLNTQEEYLKYLQSLKT